MSNYSNTKATIAANVYTNHNNEVTAAMVKAGINSVVDALIAGGYLWAGVAHPGDAASTPDANVVKVATEVGTYTNYKNSSNVALTVAAGEVAVFTYNGSWSKEVTGAATAAEVSALGQEVDEIDLYLDRTSTEVSLTTSISGKYISTSGTFGNDAGFTIRQFSIMPDKDYILTGLQVGNNYACAWAIYDANNTKLIYGGRNLTASVLIIGCESIPANGAILYVNQTNANTPKVYEQNGRLTRLEQSAKSFITRPVFPDDTNFAEAEIFNYAPFIKETYENVYYNNSGILTANTTRNATSAVKLDTTQDLCLCVTGNGDAVFFDENMTFISKIAAYVNTPISKSSFPAGAKYVAFNYIKTTTFPVGFFATTRKPLVPRLGAYDKIKVKGTRPLINIYTNDTEMEIFTKMLWAFDVKDCDVVFESGAYAFSSVYSYMKNTLAWTTRELPIGGNCRYFFNNSTLTMTPLSDIPDSVSILGCERQGGQSFELHDGFLIGNGGTYCVHDEGNGNAGAYTHKYFNMDMDMNIGQASQTLSKCIGGGSGLDGSIVIDGCIFHSENTNDVHWHGNSKTIASRIKVCVKNCWFQHGFGTQNISNANEVAEVLYTGDIAANAPSLGTGWTGYIQS